MVVDSDTDTQWGEQLVQHSQFKQGKMPSTCPEMVVWQAHVQKWSVRQWYRHTMRRTISAAQSVRKQGKMPSTSSCPVMVGRQWYRHTMRRTISAAQSVQTDAKHNRAADKMPSTSSCPVRWSDDSDTDTQWGEQLVQHSQFKQGKMPSTSSCPEMVGRQWYRHTVRRTISAAQSVETGGDAKHKLMSSDGRPTVIQTHSEENN